MPAKIKQKTFNSDFKMNKIGRMQLIYVMKTNLNQNLIVKIQFLYSFITIDPHQQLELANSFHVFRRNSYLLRQAIKGFGASAFGPLWTTNPPPPAFHTYA